MKYISNFTNFLFEQKYEFGAVMAYFNISDQQLFNELVNEADLVGDGISEEPHVTLLYGLHSNIVDSDITDLLKVFPVVSIELDTINLFENEKFDVVKFDISNDLLSDLHDELKKFPNSEAFTEYHPHLTIAYVKKGLGKKYVGSLETPIKLVLSSFVYSKANGESISVKPISL